MMFATALLAAGLLATPSPSAAPSTTTSLQYEAGVQHETLTKNYPNWDTQYLRLVEKDGGQTVYVQFDSTNRFNRQDNQFTVGAYVPLAKDWLFFGEGTASDTHHILPSSGVTAGVQYNSGSAWFEGLAARHVQYDTASVNAAVFSLEHYWNRFRVYYTMTAANVAFTGTDVEHALELDTYYGKAQQSSIGVVFVTGREVDNVGLPVLLTSHVDGVSVVGRHWMNGRWAVVYGADSFTQGTLYRRAGGHVGLDYRF